MKIKRLLFVLIIGLLFCFKIYPQAIKTDLTGSWIGSIDAGTVSLRIIFKLKITGDDKYSATMDSPDQGAEGILLGDVIIIRDSIVIKAPLLLGEYVGVIESEDNIEGVWTQAGRKFDLNLERLEEEFAIKRPQEPKPPYPYKLMDAEFRNYKADISLAGTITYPSDTGSYPAVVLVSGSGPQNRDEEIMGHKPFAVLADYLTRKGIAVLRYDDRGVAKSGGSYAGATSADFGDDAEAGVEYLKTLDFVNPSKIGIIGHSEGGLIAFMLAARLNDLAFIVSMAGPGTSGRRIIEDQTEYISRLSGVPEVTIKESYLVNSLIYDIMEDKEDSSTGINRIKDTVSAYYSDLGYDEKIINQIVNNIGNSISLSTYNWLRYFIMTEPQDYLKMIKCPVLAINGSKDSQVLADINIEGIRSGLENNENADIRIYPGLNHLFQQCETGLLNEYSQIDETISPEVLNDIAGWISDLFLQTQQ